MVLRIWNGAPNLATSTVVFGDITTSRLSSTAFTNIFRVQENTSGATNRPIMAITASGMSIPLTAGTYWVEFGLRGTLASGPFAPAKSILGQVNTGNALQYNMIGWTATLTDAGGTQGIPLTIDGNPGTDLVTTLTDTPDPVAAGASVTYTATVNNAGPNDATDVAIALPLAIGTTFVSASASAGGTCTTPAVGATGTVTCTWSGITAAAASRSVSVVAAVPANSASGTVLSVTATATSLANELNPANNAATASTTVAIAADLSVTLTDAPDPVTAGTNLTYTVTVTNAGPSDATAVVVSLPTPAGTSLVSGTVSGGGTCTAGISCAVTGSIAPGASRTLTITVLVAASVLDGTVINATATVTAGSPDPVGANNSASTTTAVVTAADLVLALASTATQVLTNVPVTFTATSLNNGPSDAQNLSITVTLTPDFRYSSHSAAGASCTTPQIGNSGVIVCTLAGTTAPGVTRTLSVVAFSNVEGTNSVNASTTSATPDPVSNNNASSFPVQVGYAIEEIPTLNAFAMLLLGLMLGLAGFVALRRQP